MAFVGNAGIDASLAVVGPGVLASLSLAIPSRVRSVGFSIGALFVLPGFLVLPSVGALGDAVGFRYGLLILVPIFTIGGLIVASAGSLIERDVRDVWTSMRTRTQMLLDRAAGRLPLLAVRELRVGYDGVAVLADVAIEIGEGEIVALRRHQRRRQVDAAAGHRRGRRGRPRRHRLRRTRHHPPAARRDRPARRGPGARRRGNLPQPARGGQPARRGLAGPAARRA